MEPLTELKFKIYQLLDRIEFDILAYGEWKAEFLDGKEITTGLTRDEINELLDKVTTVNKDG